MTDSFSLDIGNLRRLYRAGAFTPRAPVAEVQARIQDDVRNVWITRLSPAALEGYAQALEDMDPASLPLYGMPFAIKDNIDLASIPTTAGCPAYAYTPGRSATVVQRLIDAGAIPIGKTNLDQFATGLNGTRSPYGACGNGFDPKFVAGGSSSGSAVATALGYVSFALGTDTAGSGRIPAAFNNLVGLKPTRGMLSSAGVVPACRTLDTVSIFALTSDDARAVLEVAAGFDPADPYSRRAMTTRPRLPAKFRFGTPRPSQLEFFGNVGYASLYAASLTRLTALGGEPFEIDFEPFFETARLLYEGPWVAERYAAIRHFIEAQPEALHPVTRAVIEKGRDPKAVDAFAAMYRLAELRRAVEPAMGSVDVFVTPTAGTHYTMDEMQSDPVRLNSNLGHYTNFMNLLDLAAVALPAGFTPHGLPFGITLFADAWSDSLLLNLAGRMQRDLGLPLGATQARCSLGEASITLPAGHVALVVCGAHLSGLPLNHQLTDRGATLLQTSRTASRYRFYALPGGPPYRPGLVRVDQDGAAIDVEVWAVPVGAYGSFVAGIPAPLGIGTVELEDGSGVQGFVCEAYAVQGAQDITAHCGWRRFIASR
jgi:allophanate hydrolase